MNRFLHSLIAVGVLAHAIIGCGSHHECQAEETIVSQIVTHAHAGTTCHGAHTKQREAAQEAADPNVPEPCGHCDCSCILGDTDTVDFDINSDFVCCVCPLKLIIESSSLCPTRYHTEQLRHQPLWLGLRAHLAMSIFLV